MGHMTRSIVGLAAFTLTMAIGASASAAEDSDKITSQEEARVRGEAASAVQLNPSLVSISVGGRYRYMTGEHTYLQAGVGLGGASTFATSSYFAPSIHAEGKFHPVFTLRAEYSFLAFTSNERTTFDGKSVMVPDAQQRIALIPKIENKLGPLTIRAENRLLYVHTAGDGTSSYVPDFDTTVRSNDVILSSKTDFLFTPWQRDEEARLMLGPSMQSVSAIRDDYMRFRVGAALAFTPAREIGPLVRPTVFADGGINLVDANRNHQGFGQLALKGEF